MGAGEEVQDVSRAHVASHRHGHYDPLVLLLGLQMVLSFIDAWKPYSQMQQTSALLHCAHQDQLFVWEGLFSFAKKQIVSPCW